jgi:flavin-dependent dehydrogenase
VAKRCILAGTAGGFVEPITAHTLTPTVRSALIAADVIAEALAGEDVQDDLMRFKSLWRTSLADYLRPPSTSLRLLLPLLFANRRLVDRFTRALLYGENI